MSESITCPVCGRTSWHPDDVAEGYCGACHAFTSRPDPYVRDAIQQALRARAIADRLEQILTTAPEKEHN